MPEPDDPEVARRLLHHLARTSGCPDAQYLAGPARIQGGFDTIIFGFALDAVPSRWQGPLILRWARFFEVVGRLFGPAFAGVTCVRARKELFPAVARRQRKERYVRVPALAPATAMQLKGDR